MKGGADILQFPVELSAELANGALQASSDVLAVGCHDLTAPAVLQNGEDDQNDGQTQDQRSRPQRSVHYGPQLIVEE